MKLKLSTLRLANSALDTFGLELKRKTSDFYLHEYASYEQYKEVQVFHNKRKLDRVWADEQTLDIVMARVVQEFPGEREFFALCHGTRNGFEQNYIASKLNVNITGTDISDTASQFPRSKVWDFHDRNEEWVGRCDFIYTNSLDQSWKPRSALATWLDQLQTGGLLFLEFTQGHGPQGAGEMDPFGVTPSYLPYTLCDWFGHQISIEIIKTIKPNRAFEVWLFVIKKLSAERRDAQ